MNFPTNEPKLRAETILMPALSHMWYQLTRPHPEIPDRIERERARLLASLVLAFLAVQVVLMLFTIVRQGLGAVFLALLIHSMVTILVYAFSRSPRYYTGIILLAALSLASALVVNFIVPDPHVTSLILLPVLLVGLLWSASLAVIILLLGVVGFLMIGMQNGNVYELLIYYMPVNLALAVLIIVAVYQIQQSRMRLVEQRRQSEKHRRDLELERQRLALVLGLIGQLSHDLMTPLTIMKTSTYLVGRANTDSHIHHHLDKLNHEADRLENMVQDLVLMSRLDRLTPDDFDFKPHNVGKIIGRVAEKYGKLATRAGCELQVTSDQPQIMANVDEAALYRALANILESAIHNVNQDGVINLTLDHDTNDVRITIAGCKSPEFDGLGLDIARMIITAHGGTLDLPATGDQEPVVLLALPSV